MNCRLTAFAFALVTVTGCSTTQPTTALPEPLPQPVVQEIPAVPPVVMVDEVQQSEPEVREQYAAPAAASAVAQSRMTHDMSAQRG